MFKIKNHIKDFMFGKNNKIKLNVEFKCVLSLDREGGHIS